MTDWTVWKVFRLRAGFEAAYLLDGSKGYHATGGHVLSDTEEQRLRAVVCDLFVHSGYFEALLCGNEEVVVATLCDPAGTMLDIRVTLPYFQQPPTQSRH